MADVIQLRPDTFRPMSFTLTADKARAAHADARMATTLILWAQEARETALRHGLGLPQRLKLLEALGAVLDHPKVT